MNNVILGDPGDIVATHVDRHLYKNTCIALSADVLSSYDICEEMGATVPEEKTSSQLPDCIRSIKAAKPEQTKIVTPLKDGTTVTPDSGYALSSVVVNGDANFLAEYIKEGIQIFGVTGTHKTHVYYDPSTTVNRFSANLYGARIVPSEILSEVDSSVYSYIAIESITIISNGHKDANSFRLKILDANDNVLGDSAVNEHAFEDFASMTFVFDTPVKISSTAEYVKVMAYDSDGTQMILIPNGCKAYQHDGSTNYGIYQGSLTNTQWNIVESVVYYGTNVA